MARILEGCVAVQVLMCGCLSLATADDGPLPLTDAQLDSVSAGYVALGIAATAEALGPHSIALTFAGTELQVGGDDVGDLVDDVGEFVYTEASGIGYAYARGDTVYTEVVVHFDTDEQILSSDIVYVERSGLPGHRLAESPHAFGDAVRPSHGHGQGNGHGYGHGHGLGQGHGHGHGHGDVGALPRRARHGGYRHGRGGHRHGGHGVERPEVEVKWTVVRVVTRRPVTP